MSITVCSFATQKMKGKVKLRDHFVKKGGAAGLQLMTTFLTWSSTYSYFPTILRLHMYITLHHTLIFKRLSYIITG